LGNVIEREEVIPEVSPGEFRFTEITQILYIDKGILCSYVPMVTPTLSLYTSTGQYVGETFYFSTAFNFKYENKTRKKDKIIFLQETNKKISLANSDVTLKELYNRNMVETIWPQVLSNKIDVYDVATNKKLDPAALHSSVQYKAATLSPIYDSVDVVFKYETINEPAKPGDFSHAALLQDWYYNQTKNIIFSKIKELYLYATPLNGKEPVEVIKLVFK